MPPRRPFTAESTGVSRITIRGAQVNSLAALLDEAASSRVRSLNVFARAHRNGDLANLDQLLLAEFGVLDPVQAPTIQRATRDARRKLSKVRRSLRVKSVGRMGTLPAVGHLRPLLGGLLAQEGILPAAVINAAFHRERDARGSHWVIRATIQGEPKQADLWAWHTESARPSLCEDIGVAPAPEGLWVSRRQIRAAAVVLGKRGFDGHRALAYNVAVDDFRGLETQHKVVYSLI